MFVDLKEKVVTVLIKTDAMLKNVNNKNTFFIITRSPFNIFISAKMFFQKHTFITICKLWNWKMYAFIAISYMWFLNLN